MGWNHDKRKGEHRCSPRSVPYTWQTQVPDIFNYCSPFLMLLLLVVVSNGFYIDDGFLSIKEHPAIQRLVNYFQLIFWNFPYLSRVRRFESDVRYWLPRWLAIIRGSIVNHVAPTLSTNAWDLLDNGIETLDVQHKLSVACDPFPTFCIHTQRKCLSVSFRSLPTWIATHKQYFK